MHDDSDEELMLDMFKEPDNFRPKTPEPTIHSFNRSNGSSLEIELIGQHSLWSHCLWNAGITIAKYIDSKKINVRNFNTLELGAAAALPSFMCSLNGAKKVVITDYPDEQIINSILKNTKTNDLLNDDTVKVQGYLWGDDVQPLLKNLESDSLFDLIIMSDLIFNHTEHHKLLKAAVACLEKTKGVILVGFTHHRPHLAHKDMHFFEIASKEFDLKVEHLFDEKMKEMFTADPGDVDVRRTVHVYKLFY